MEDILVKETAPGESGRQEGCCVRELLGKNGGDWECGSFPVAQLVKNPPVMQETPVRFLSREDLLEKR